jgi:adenylate cyclase
VNTLVSKDLIGRGTHPFSLLALFAILLVVIDASLLGLFRNFDDRFNDWLMRTLAEKRVPAAEIVIIDIDEKSLEQMAATHGRYPWPRSVHAELIEGVEQQQPRAIIFDIIFADPDRQHPDADTYLSEVARENSNLFFPFVRLQSTQQGEGLELDHYGARLGFSEMSQQRTGESVALLLPYLALELEGRLGGINFIEDSDGVGRRYPLYLTEGDWLLPSIVARVAQYLGYSIPQQESIRLNWQGPVLSYPRISYSEIYDDLMRETHQRAGDEFKDKIVIIGSTATGMHDLRNTPMGSLHPAIEIIATALDNLRDGSYLQELSEALPLLFTLLSIGLLWWLFMAGFSPLFTGGLMLFWSLLLMLIDYLLLNQKLLLPVVTTLIFVWLYYALAALYAYRSERRARQQSIQIFSRFLDPRVVKELVSSGESVLNMRSESRQITVLFSDIRGFTTMSEQHSATEIVDILNRYFSRQVKVIFHHGGTVDKFIGDAIMAFWGAPVGDDNQAVNAVNAALDMVDVLKIFSEEIDAQEQGFDVGIGIHSGECVVGFIGSENRLDYTAIGDTVNLASRIEGQTKGIARILISSETRQQCGEQFEFIDHGIFAVKGRAEEVQLFEPRRRAL